MYTHNILVSALTLTNFDIRKSADWVLSETLNVQWKGV